MNLSITTLVIFIEGLMDPTLEVQQYNLNRCTIRIPKKYQIIILSFPYFFIGNKPRYACVTKQTLPVPRLTIVVSMQNERCRNTPTQQTTPHIEPVREFSPSWHEKQRIKQTSNGTFSV